MCPLYDIFPTEDYCEITVVATNNGDDPVTLQFNSAQQFDFIAKDGEGNIVWRWSDGMVFDRGPTTVTLGPDDSITKTVTWEYAKRGGKRVMGGQYLVQGFLTTQPEGVYAVPQEVEVVSDYDGD